MNIPRLIPLLVSLFLLMLVMALCSSCERQPITVEERVQTYLKQDPDIDVPNSYFMYSSGGAPQTDEEKQAVSDDLEAWRRYQQILKARK